MTTTTRAQAPPPVQDGLPAHDTPPVFDAARLMTLWRRMGRELTDRREARGLQKADVQAAVGFKTLEGVSGVERGRRFTRASRLRPWLALLGYGVDATAAFLALYAEVIAPPDGGFPFEEQLREQRRAERPAKPAPAGPSRDVVLACQAALGAELWQRRASKGLTRATVAERSGLTMLRIRQVERGLLRHRPTERELWAITDALGAGPIWAFHLIGTFPGAIASDSLGIPPDTLGAVDAPLALGRRPPRAPGHHPESE